MLCYHSTRNIKSRRSMCRNMAEMMGDMDIAFPNLGSYLRNVPKTIMIGNFGIALYGIVIAIGMILGLTMSARIAKT